MLTPPFPANLLPTTHLALQPITLLTLQAPTGVSASPLNPSLPKTLTLTASAIPQEAESSTSPALASWSPSRLTHIIGVNEEGEKRMLRWRSGRRTRCRGVAGAMCSASGTLWE